MNVFLTFCDSSKHLKAVKIVFSMVRTQVLLLLTHIFCGHTAYVCTLKDLYLLRYYQYSLQYYCTYRVQIGHRACHRRFTNVLKKTQDSLDLYIGRCYSLRDESTFTILLSNNNVLDCSKHTQYKDVVIPKEISDFWLNSFGILIMVLGCPYQPFENIYETYICTYSQLEHRFEPLEFQHEFSFIPKIVCCSRTYLA